MRVEGSSDQPDGQRGLRQVWRLIVSDYYAFYAFKQEDEQRLRLLMLPRLATNSSLHANILVRLIVGTPQWLSYLWRRMLISFHAMDISQHITIGPGLELPHPVSIVIGTGTHIGSNVCIHHGVSAGPSAADNSGRVYEAASPLLIEEGVILYPYAHVQANVGAGSEIAHHASVSRPIPANSIAAGAPARVVRQREQLEATGSLN